MRTTRSSLTTLGEDFLLGAGVDDEQQWNAAQRLRERQGQLKLGSGCFSVYYPISIPFSRSLTFLLIFMILGRRYQRICHLRWPRTEGLFSFSHLPPKPRKATGPSVMRSTGLCGMPLCTEEGLYEDDSEWKESVGTGAEISSSQYLVPLFPYLAVL